MQTFLPYPSFTRSARVLDYRRLGKQRIEAKQILKALSGEYPKAWRNHPVTKMWVGHEYQLCQYAIAMCQEWIRRGYVDNQLPWFQAQSKRYKNTKLPAWIGRRKFHAAHRSNLLRKNAEFYNRYCWKEPTTLDYEWPI